ncbi:MAG: transglycosylase SLT domain-containing protein [Kiloniellales bacterium]|nr:transglycosylase SLT domain-containing protein [Kiloniellales bacterium]
MKRALTSALHAAAAARLAAGLLLLSLAACAPPWAVDAETAASPAAAEAPDEAPLSDVWPPLAEPWTGDLDGMIERGQIRLLTSFSLGTYFIDGGRPRGTLAEGAEAFRRFFRQKLGERAKALKLVIIPVRRDQLLPFLVEGYGDLASATLRITPRRRALVDFSLPFTDRDREHLILGPASPALASLDDLAGQEVVVREDSSYFDSLQDLNADFRARGRPEIEITLADPRLETEDLIEMVHAGLLPMTVADDFRTRLWTRVFGDLETRDDLVVHDRGEIAVALRKDSPQLKALVDDYVRTHRLGTRIANLAVARYRDRVDWVRPALKREPFHRFQEAEALFRKYGARYGFDWLLLASFAYQESRLDQGARSPAGAVGIMQVLPSTARDPAVGIPDIERLEDNVHAGTKYLAVLRDRYFADPALDPFERSLFTMAGYNAGPNRVNRLRRRAADRGLDPDRWFNNVELVVAAAVGREPVDYVRNIYQYYVAYKRGLAELEERKKARPQPDG